MYAVKVSYRNLVSLFCKLNIIINFASKQVEFETLIFISISCEQQRIVYENGSHIYEKSK